MKFYMENYSLFVKILIDHIRYRGFSGKPPWGGVLFFASFSRKIVKNPSFTAFFENLWVSLLLKKEGMGGGVLFFASLSSKRWKKTPPPGGFPENPL